MSLASILKYRQFLVIVEAHAFHTIIHSISIALLGKRPKITCNDCNRRPRGADFHATSLYLNMTLTDDPFIIERYKGWCIAHPELILYPQDHPQDLNSESFLKKYFQTEAKQLIQELFDQPRPAINKSDKEAVYSFIRKFNIIGWWGFTKKLHKLTTLSWLKIRKKNREKTVVWQVSRALAKWPQKRCNFHQKKIKKYHNSEFEPTIFGVRVQRLTNKPTGATLEDGGVSSYK